MKWSSYILIDLILVLFFLNKKVLGSATAYHSTLVQYYIYISTQKNNFALYPMALIPKLPIIIFFPTFSLFSTWRR